MSFGPHLAHVHAKVVQHCRALLSVTSKTLGWDREILLSLYHGLIRGVLGYCAAAWQPWLSPTNVAQLERADLRALRVVTGQLKTTPVDAMHAEIGIPPYGLVCKYLAAAALEKARRVPPDHPRRIALEAPVPRHRTTRQSLRVLANDVIGGTSLRGTETKPLFGSPAPVPLDPRRCSITPDLPGYARKGATGILDSAKECIDHWLPDIVIYTDGSVAGGIHDGGSAAVVTRGEASSHDVIKCYTGEGVG